MAGVAAQLNCTELPCPGHPQVGCLVHEVMCGCLPFECEDKRLSAALILWAEVTTFPDDLSPQLVAFMRVSE